MDLWGCVKLYKFENHWRVFGECTFTTNLLLFIQKENEPRCDENDEFCGEAAKGKSKFGSRYSMRLGIL